MKKPKFAAVTMQEQIDGGINAFAVQLVAESHADSESKFGDETVMVVGKSHKGTPVYMLISTLRPSIEQFAGWPESGPGDHIVDRDGGSTE